MLPICAHLLREAGAFQGRGSSQGYESRSDTAMVGRENLIGGRQHSGLTRSAYRENLRCIFWGSKLREVEILPGLR